MSVALTAADIEAAEIGDWRLLARALHTRFATRDFATGLALVDEIGEMAEEADHHPDVDLRYLHLDVALMSHDVGAVTQRDIDMARRISAVAAARGIAARPEKVATVEIALDTADTAAQQRFWAAVLDAEAVGTCDVLDRSGQIPLLWLQETDPHEEPRQRFHLDLWLPAEVVEARIEAAVAAGGRLVDEAQAPAFWVLADPEGNKVCVCTSRSRD